MLKVQKQLYINFVDLQNAVDSVYSESLGCILRAYGVPQNIVQLIQSVCKAFTCCVEDGEICLEVQKGDRQSCAMSALM